MWKRYGIHFKVYGVENNLCMGMSRMNSRSTSVKRGSSLKFQQQVSKRQSSLSTMI